MGVFLIKDTLIDQGVVTATGLTPPSYTWTRYALPVPTGDPTNASVSFGGYAYYALSSTGADSWSLAVSYSGMTPGAVNVYLEPVFQDTFNSGTCYMLYDATHTTGPATWTNATVTANCGVNGSDLTTWCVAVRRPDTMARLNVIAFVSAPVDYVEGDTWSVSGGCSLNDRGRIAVSTFKYDRTNPRNWLSYAYLDTYQLQDDGWTRLARTSTPHQQFHSAGFAKTLDNSILIATDFDATDPAAGVYRYGYYVASYDAGGAFTVGDKLNVGNVNVVWGTYRNSMVRLPGTNDFVVLRTGSDQPLVDLVRVSGTTVTLLDTQPIPPSSLTTSWTAQNDGDNLVALDSANVITTRWTQYFPPDFSGPFEVVQLMHFGISGDAITITTQEFTPGRPTMPRGGLATYRSPVAGHQVETMWVDFTDYANQHVPVVRRAFDYSGGTFTVTNLPADQTFLTNYNDPPNYPHRTTNGRPGFGPFTGDYTVVDDQIYITQGYYENSTDDTWFLVWQVDGTTGKITAFSWSKGPQDGAEGDNLFYDDIFAFYDQPTSQLVVLSYLEFYPGGGGAWASSNRMATYRLDYSLSAKLRSHRWAFTPTS